MATILLSDHKDNISIGPNWVIQFIKWYSDLASKYNCKYNYQQV